MQPWAQAVLAACAVVLTVVAVPTILALRRAAVRAETVLSIVEQELRPLVGEVFALADARAAFERSLGDHRPGKIVLRVTDDAEA